MKKKIIIADMLKQLEIWSKLILNALKKEAFQCIVKESDKKLDKESRKFKITQYK